MQALPCKMLNATTGKLINVYDKAPNFYLKPNIDLKLNNRFDL